MRKVILSFVLLLGILLMPAKVSAAAITMNDLPYFCDFEDDVEMQNWVLNPGINSINTRNRFVVGEAMKCMGNRSLYVSQDDGATASYAPDNNALVAYRDVTLEAGVYDIAYDYSGKGGGTDGYMKIVFANRADGSSVCVGNNSEPQWVTALNSTPLMGGETMLTEADGWHHVQMRLNIPVGHANKTTTRIFFVWVNSNAGKSSTQSVAIDNFQLAKAPAIYPDNMHVGSNLGESMIYWDGAADSYELLWKKKGDTDFQSTDSYTASFNMGYAEFGAYEFWMRVRNGADESIYFIFNTVYIYQTDCFDALNMYGATFEYGTWNKTSGKTVKGNTRVDFGPESMDSRHTTHFDQTETDPRTRTSVGGVPTYLKTIPQGEYGSIRLGNWKTGSEYESITFKYTVDSRANAILIIHYAIVLENPDHPADEQPRFTLDVFNEAGEPIDTKCASVDFHSPTNTEWSNPEIREIWHDAGSVKWQDWNTIGISVEDYVGQTLTIQLTSYDCDQSGHFGYAYFMLNCSRSDVDGLPWGDDGTTQMFTAPEGFNYAWFNRMDKQFRDTLSKDRFFPVHETDTNTYLCHVTYPSNPECGWWFDASAKPHNPKAELEWRWEPKDCQNGFRYFNRCHVMLTNQETGEVEHRYDKQLENCTLILPDGTRMPIGYDEEGVYVPVSNDGDTFIYGIETGVYVNETLFSDIEYVTIEIPPIGPLETHLYDTICEGEYIVFPEEMNIKRTETDTYINLLTSVVTGCDSTVYMHLTVHELPSTNIYDTICTGQTYLFNGRELVAPAVAKAIFPSVLTGCDSLVTLYLTEAVQPTIELVSSQVCPDEGLLLAISNADFFDTLRVVVADVVDTVILGGDVPDTIAVHAYFGKAGEHQLLTYVHEPYCDGYDQLTTPFAVSLSSSVVEAKFDDVLTFLDTDYNGGYTFTSFVWYKNGVLMEDVTDGYYYEPGLDYDAEFTVQVTLADGTQVWVCPFTFRSRLATDVSEVVAAEHKAHKILRDSHLIIIYNDHEYNALGIKIK